MPLRIFLVALLLAAFAGSSSAVAFEPEGEAVTATWARTDLPVAEGRVSRTWIWGPEAITEAMAEPYAEAPAQLRPVQYFDKARMEITDPGDNPTSPWYVTNGLLVVEMVTGRMQTGDAEFEEREPAGVNAAGDPDDPDAPTYRTLGTLLEEPAHPAGQPITATIDRDGLTGELPSLSSYGIEAGAFVADVNHAVAGPFWQFMHQAGLVYEDGEYQTGLLFEPWFYATGLPITEAYWTEVNVAGTTKWVLIQAFERRVLTYTPDNPEGWQVEAGNVGRHYLEWRYGDAGPEPPAEPDPPAGTMTIDIAGIEIDAGETVGDVTYGARFIGNASGSLEGSMDVAIDYTPPYPGPNVTNTIVGGTWSLTADSGSLEGTIASGTAIWDEGVDEAAVSATFAITTATGDFEGIAGTGAFSGVLSHRTFPPRITGTLVFQIEEG